MTSDATIILAKRNSALEEIGEELVDAFWNSEIGWVENRFEATIFPRKYGENLARWMKAPYKALQPVAVSSKRICPCCGGKVQIPE